MNHGCGDGENRIVDVEAERSDLRRDIVLADLVIGFDDVRSTFRFGQGFRFDLRIRLVFVFALVTH